MHEDVSRWGQRAARRRTDPDLFLPLNKTVPTRDRVRQAQQICRTCTVQWTRLDRTLRHGVPDGVRGRSTGSERRAMSGVPLVPSRRIRSAAQPRPQQDACRTQDPA
ncbi:WhiB family transcriptional regulator [Streptomyces sp. CoH27]|uniref:WhiB family transcriptional regulator n=1 Tax=Streptomyces sp. CoH27 TaxID=2875763 RepID=UPI001CD38666